MLATLSRPDGRLTTRAITGKDVIVNQNLSNSGKVLYLSREQDSKDVKCLSMSSFTYNIVLTSSVKSCDEHENVLRKLASEPE